MNMGVRVFLQVSAFSSFGHIPEMELLDPMVVFLNFEERLYCFPWWLR